MRGMGFQGLSKAKRRYELTEQMEQTERTVGRDVFKDDFPTSKVFWESGN